MLFVADRCVGCRTCQMVCSLTHDGACGPSLARVSVEAEGLRLRAEFNPECDECAACAGHCPYGAIEES
ncbi:MAG: hypothetical protein HPY75_07495 [Actinobacteria bacterium]|nr:hypothetical protein [Actinomycetota bacterium]